MYCGRFLDGTRGNEFARGSSSGENPAWVCAGTKGRLWHSEQVDGVAVGQFGLPATAGGDGDAIKPGLHLAYAPACACGFTPYWLVGDMVYRLSRSSRSAH